MKIAIFGSLCAAIIGMALAEPALAQRNGLADTGSMDYPAPLPQGNIGTATVVGPNRATLARANRPAGTGTPANPVTAGSVGSVGTR